MSKPVGTVTGWYGGHPVIEPVDGWIPTVGTVLYSAPDSLTAAAPDLLDALVMVLDDPNALDGRPRTYEIVCAAIAKAKGEA